MSELRFLSELGAELDRIVAERTHASGATPAPARARPRWHRRLGGVPGALALAASVLVVVAVAGAILLTTRHPAQPAATTPSSPMPPRTFVAAYSGPGDALGFTVSLFSATTGRATRRLASFGADFTDNGLAIAPDRASVYFTLIPAQGTVDRGLRLMKLDVASGRQTFVARGSQPAISAAGTELAYGAAPEGIAVRELGSGTTRTLSLRPLLGAAANLLDTPMTWLANGSEVAFIARAPAVAAGAGAAGANVQRGSCEVGTGGASVVFVHVPPPPAALSARCIKVAMAAVAGGTAILSGSEAHPGSLLIAAAGLHTTTVERIEETGAVTRVLSFGASLPMALDPTGTQLLYLVGHRPPSLWEATITPGHLIHRRRLIANSKLDALAW
jgi:hypothetical protein